MSRHVNFATLLVACWQKPTRIEPAGIDCAGKGKAQDQGIEMNALMMVIALWLSANFGLPMTDNLPRVEFVPAARLVALRSEALLSATGKDALPEATTGLEDVVAAYDDVSKAILLRDDWKGRTPAEISVLVHEMVHHGQDLAGGTYGCRNEREKLAYEAQERWLGLFGRDLASEFQIDPFTRLMKTLCAY